MTLRRLLIVSSPRLSFSPASRALRGTSCTRSPGLTPRSSSTTVQGSARSHLDPGVFSLTVDDRSDGHNFHLFGPGGVDVSTDVAAVGVKTFSVTLVDGTYAYLCDVHPVQMKSTFAVGTATSPPSTPPPTNPPPPTTGTPTRLVLTVTSQAVTLKTPAGKAVVALKAGRAAGLGARPLRDPWRQAERRRRQQDDRCHVRRHRDLERPADEGHTRLCERRAQAGAPRWPRAGFL